MIFMIGCWMGSKTDSANFVRGLLFTPRGSNLTPCVSMWRGHISPSQCEFNESRQNGVEIYKIPCRFDSSSMPVNQVIHMMINCHVYPLIHRVARKGNFPIYHAMHLKQTHTKWCKQKKLRPKTLKSHSGWLSSWTIFRCIYKMNLTIVQLHCSIASELRDSEYVEMLIWLWCHLF